LTASFTLSVALLLHGGRALMKNFHFPFILAIESEATIHTNARNRNEIETRE